MEKLLRYLNALDKPAREKFCLAVGTTERYLRKAVSKGQRFGTNLCIDIDRESASAVRCEDLLPDADWAYIRASAPPDQLSAR